MYVCVYICIYICVYTYIYIYIYVYRDILEALAGLLTCSATGSSERAKFRQLRSMLKPLCGKSVLLNA